MANGDDGEVAIHVTGCQPNGRRRRRRALLKKGCILLSISPKREQQTTIYEDTVCLGKHATKDSELSFFYADRICLRFSAIELEILNL